MSRKRHIRPVAPVAERGGLILPGHYNKLPGARIGVCNTCGDRFYRGQEQEWQDHVGPCARRHLPEILEARAEQKKRLALFHESDNPDVDAHLAKVGARMLREGRLTMKKSERIFNE